MPDVAVPYHVDAALDAALDAGLKGCGVSRDDALSLMSDSPLTALLQAAATVRDRVKGPSVSYSRKVFIPLTHLCRDYCGYCTFRADPQAGVQPYMTPDEVLAVAEAGRRAGCKEALFSLGDQPERIFPEAKDFLKGFGIRSHARISCGHVRPGAGKDRAPSSFQSGADGRGRSSPPAGDERQRGADARERQSAVGPPGRRRIGKRRTKFLRSACEPSKTRADYPWPSPRAF